MAGSSLQVTKVAAAQRQLRAAIRMFFAGEDELAIHTAASAAYKLIANLKEQRGRDEVADYYLTAIFYVVRDYSRGTLPSRFTNDPEAMAWIRDMAGRLPITAESMIEDVKVSVGAETARSWWSRRNRVANFLKHADRDPRSHIPLEEVDNLHLLMLALGSYSDLVKDDLGPEGLFLWMYSDIINGKTEQLPKQYQQMAAEIQALDEHARLRFCSAVLREMRNEEKGPDAPT